MLALPLHLCLQEKNRVARDAVVARALAVVARPPVAAARALAVVARAPAALADHKILLSTIGALIFLRCINSSPVLKHDMSSIMENKKHVRIIYGKSRSRTWRMSGSIH
jgi:hypothetical protein